MRVAAGAEDAPVACAAMAVAGSNGAASAQASLIDRLDFIIPPQEFVLSPNIRRGPRPPSLPRLTGDHEPINSRTAIWSIPAGSQPQCSGGKTRPDRPRSDTRATKI